MPYVTWIIHLPFEIIPHNTPSEVAVDPQIANNTSMKRLFRLESYPQQNLSQPCLSKIDRQPHDENRLPVGILFLCFAIDVGVSIGTNLGQSACQATNLTALLNAVGGVFLLGKENKGDSFSGAN